MSDTPRTDAIWTEFYDKYPDHKDISVRIFFDMKMRTLERDLASVTAGRDKLKAALGKALMAGISEYMRLRTEWEKNQNVTRSYIGVVELHKILMKHLDAARASSTSAANGGEAT